MLLIGMLLDSKFLGNSAWKNSILCIKASIQTDLAGYCRFMRLLLIRCVLCKPMATFLVCAILTHQMRPLQLPPFFD